MSRRAAVAVLALGLLGCASEDGPVVIATNLPTTLCEALEREADGERIIWLRLAPGMEPARVLGHPGAADLVAGGALASYEAPEARAGTEPGTLRGLRLGTLGLAVNPDWFAARALPEPRRWEDLQTAALTGLIALGDPREDPMTLGLAEAWLSRGPWSEGYAALVALAANAAPIGRGRAASGARLTRGEVGLAPALQGSVRAPMRFVPLVETPRAEGLAVVRGASRLERARRLLARFEAQGRAVPPETTSVLLPELLGAALVEAQNELVEARAAIERMPPGPRRAKLAADLGEPPPWPPASVRMLSSPELVDDLAVQVAPDQEARTWLLQSWEQPAQPLDGSRIAALETAADGTLAAEPHFRAWLRAEWTAWARQRYRRVAREARKVLEAPVREEPVRTVPEGPP